MLDVTQMLNERAIIGRRVKLEPCEKSVEEREREKEVLVKYLFTSSRRLI